MAVGVKMRKGNRVLHVEEDRVDSFLAQGYDQINKNGEVVKRATGGRTVSLQEYNKVVDQLDELKANANGDGEGKSLEEYDKLHDAHQELSEEHDKLVKEHEELKKENSQLKGKITRLEKETKDKEAKKDK